MPGVVSGLLIASTISKVATELTDRLQSRLGRTAAPDLPLVKRAIELISSIGAFDLNNLPSEATPETVEFWLKRLLRTAQNFNPALTKDDLASLFGKCYGAPNGSGMLPVNRATVPIPTDGIRVDYLYEIKLNTVPAQIDIGAKEFEKLVQGAWQRWIAGANLQKLNVQMLDGHAAAPNMVIEFGALDGEGGNLAVATTTQSGNTFHYGILIDVHEKWTKAKLLTTMVHEIGHTLGLDHVGDGNAIMAASLNPAFNTKPLKSIKLTPTDEAALQTTRWA
jgi:hypothetical protein